MLEIFLHKFCFTIYTFFIILFFQNFKISCKNICFFMNKSIESVYDKKKVYKNDDLNKIHKN